MNEKAKNIIDQLGLVKHPEGGYYRETYRSPETTLTQRGNRNFCTVIYYLLPAGEKSAKHRVLSDELWIHQDGDTVLLTLFTDSGETQMKLGKANDSTLAPQVLVPAGTWFSAEISGSSHALVSCIVSPGFSFEDFEMAD